KFLEVFARVLAIIFFDQCDAFFTGNLTVANLVSAVRRCPSDAELDVGEIVMEPVDPVVQARVLGVGSFRTLRIGLKAGIFATVIIVFLWIPELVVAQK